MQLILGSGSSGRRRLFEAAGIPFIIVKPEIDEKKIRAVDHAHTPLMLSFAKAHAVARKISEPAIIIGCDQVVMCDGRIMEKPETPDELREW